MINFLKAVIPAIFKTWEDTRKKDKKICPLCKDTGKILVACIRIGTITEYEDRTCHCIKKK